MTFIAFQLLQGLCLLFDGFQVVRMILSQQGKVGVVKDQGDPRKHIDQDHQEGDQPKQLRFVGKDHGASGEDADCSEEGEEMLPKLP